MAAALMVAVLLAGGAWLALQRGMLRVVVGFVLIAHAVNLLLLLAGSPGLRRPPIGHDLDPAQVADPLPQALVLTAIVISFAVTVLMLALAVVGDGDDDTDTDLTGREVEPPDLLDHEHAVPRPHRAFPHSDWHSYLDPSDDLPAPAPERRTGSPTTRSGAAGTAPVQHPGGQP